jgi:Vacuolar protein 14 C-terminal Fig4p binding
MDKFCLSVCIIVGVIMRWQRSRYVYLRKHMNTLRTYYRVCASSLLTPANTSGDLEITVQFLIQVDKLVQILESPVFTCNPSIKLAKDRFEIAAS